MTHDRQKTIATDGTGGAGDYRFSVDEMMDDKNMRAFTGILWGLLFTGWLVMVAVVLLWLI